MMLVFNTDLIGYFFGNFFKMICSNLCLVSVLAGVTEEQFKGSWTGPGSESSSHVLAKSRM